MGRPRKIISMQTGNIKKDVRAKREYEESLKGKKKPAEYRHNRQLRP